MLSYNRFLTRPLTLIFAFLVLLIGQLVIRQASFCQTANDSPIDNNVESVEPSVKLLPLVKEESISTYLVVEKPEEVSVLPNKNVPNNDNLSSNKLTAEKLTQRLALNIIYPAKPRYADGAPVVVVVPGGDEPNGLTFNMHAAQVGFIEIRFAFPGGGTKSFHSSGKKDFRGSDSEFALSTIIQFASSKLTDYRGRTLSELLPIKVSPNNLGLVGWSNGGNIALATMSKYANSLSNIAWVAFYESPIGEFFFPPNLGSTKDLLLNKHYHEGSGATGHCLVDFRKIQWQPDLNRNPGARKKLEEPEIAGVVFFDENGNKHWDEATEYAFNYCLDSSLQKQFYPPEIIQALERFNVFEKGWPSTIATLEESENYYQERDGSLYIPSICKQFPNLLVTIFASQMDHLERQPDHPHIVSQYNTWLDNGAHWVRLNPEPIYVSTLANMNHRNFVSNKPNDALDAIAIIDFLEPEGSVLDYVFMDATIAELADRKRNGNLNSPLEDVLVKYSNGLAVPPLASPEPKKTEVGSPATSK